MIQAPYEISLSIIFKMTQNATIALPPFNEIVQVKIHSVLWVRFIYLRIIILKYPIIWKYYRFIEIVLDKKGIPITQAIRINLMLMILLGVVACSMCTATFHPSLFVY
jgi:hypothetical protein